MKQKRPNSVDVRQAISGLEKFRRQLWPSLLAVLGLAMGTSRALADVTIYQDDFNDQQNINQGGPYTQSLTNSVPTVRNAIAGGSASARWQAGVETGGWGQRDYNNNNVATPTSSNFLPFTPQAGVAYRLQATIDTTGAAGLGSSWFTVGFTSSQHNWNGADVGTIDLADLVRFNDAKSSTITYTVWGDALVAAGIQYVGWITDGAGTVNLSPTTPQVKIDNFSLVKIDNPCTNGYAANGATSGTAPVDGTIYSSNATVTVLGNINSLAKNGYNFAGWNTAADGSGTAYSPSNTFVISSNTVLYAQWTLSSASTLLLSDNFNTVTTFGVSEFNSHLATDQSGILAPVTYAVAGYDQDYKIQHGNGGYMLLAGWFNSVSLDLYASLNTNFAAYANSYNQPLKVQFDLMLTSASNPNNWATIAIGSSKNAFVNNTTNKFSSLFRLNGGTQQFASGTDVSGGFTWNATNSTITVILSDTNNVGSPFNGNGSVGRIYVNGILAYTRTLSQMTATDGYISSEANGVMAYYDNMSVSVAPIYSVTYSGNGSTGGSAPADSRSPYAAASTVTVLGNTGSLTNNGFYFGGWNTAANGSGTTYLPGNTFSITGNTILYARWLSGYVVTYSGNGNTGGSAPVDNNLYAPGASATVLGTNTLFKTNFVFANWNTAANGTGTSYPPGATVTVTNNIALYAQWSMTNGVWDNGTGNGNWSSTNANWSGGYAWNNSPACNAFFATVGGTINLTQPITAGSVNVGNANVNVPNTTFANGSLTASSLTIQGNGSNGSDYSSNPTLTLGVPTVSIASDLAVGRANLVITSGNVSANRIISSAASADWADVTINGGTVTATNGVDGSVNTPATFQLDLNGGALYTPFIKVADREAGGNALLTFNGTVVHPTVNTNNFITLYGGNQNTYVGNGGVNFSTDGKNIGLGINLLASGTGGLTKTGTGTLTLNGTNTYIGTTLVQGGVLSIGSTTALGAGPVNITNGAVMNLNYSGQIQVSGLTLNGVAQPAGTYGATGSGATYTNNTYFTGTGRLSVSPVALTWDNGSASGNWNSTDLNWSGYSWSSVYLHDAIFGAAGVGTVTLTEAITAKSLTFNTAGYTLTGGSLILTGPQAITNNANATIISPFDCSALNKYGAGTLTLGGNTVYLGSLAVNAGTVSLTSPLLDACTTVSIAAGAKMNLNYTGTNAILSLTINGTNLPTGTYNAQHPVYGSYFTGTGSLRIFPLTYELYGGNENWPAGIRAAIVASMNEGAANYNAFGYFPMHVGVNYNSGVPTANAGYGGPITFGGSISGRTAIHELQHCMGIGTYWAYATQQSGGLWTGAHGNQRMQLYLGPGATIGCDGAHFWPYGMNYDYEDSSTARYRHVKMVAAMRWDMGIVGDSNNDGVPDDWDMFWFGTLTPSVNASNNLAAYLADVSPLPTVSLVQTNLAFSVSGTNLTLSWPADHVGWTLLQQTNRLPQGVSANASDWMRVAGSSSTNLVVLPILPGSTGGYYRLVYP